MKKIYSLVTLFVMAAFSLCASAQAAGEEETAIDRVITFLGDDRVSIQVGAGDDAVINHPTDGKFVLQVPAAKANDAIVIFSDNPEIIIVSVKDSQDHEIVNNEAKYRVYPREFGAAETFTIATKEVDINNSFLLIVDQPSKIKISRQGGNYESIAVTGAQFDIPISEVEAENNFLIEPKTGVIYSVTKNGKKARMQANGRRWYVDDLKAGDVVDVKVETPEIMVPITFTGATGAIEKVIVNGELRNDWADEDFAVRLNSNFVMEYKTNWKVQRLEINGNRYTGGAINNFDITSEGPHVIEVIGDIIKDIQITVKCPDYEHLIVKNVTSAGTKEVELTGAETTFGVTPNTELSFAIKAGDYYFSKFADNVGGIYEVPTKSVFVRLGSRYVDFDIELDIFERKGEVTFFVEDFQWNNLTCRFQNPLGGITYSCGENPTTDQGTIELKSGYSHLPFDSKDLIIFSGYNPNYEMKVYHNGEEVENYNYGVSDAKSGDVFKIFSAEPKSYAVKYDIQEGANVEVVHDIKSTVETPASHTLFHGTDIVIRRPVKAEATAAEDESKDLQVSVDGEALKAEADGTFHLVATKDMNIQVKDPSAAGISNVAVDAEGPQEIYNLQGMRVGNTADGATLPSGVYIVGGKKVRY